jgi:hypothetical protein
VLVLVGVGAIYLALAATVFAPVNTHGTRVDHFTVHSKAAGPDLGVSVVVPAGAHSGSRRCLSFCIAAAAPTPIVAFPGGGEHGYRHDRAEGDWGTYVMDEVIPQLIRRFAVDPSRVAIGGISMGDFGAYDIALQHPGSSCAVGGHSPALCSKAEKPRLEPSNSPAQRDVSLTLN